MSYVYLATPYSHENPAVMDARADEAIRYVADLSSGGEVVFSPIVHYHEAAKRFGMPRHYEFWHGACTAFLDKASALYVVMLDGWRESLGVKHEIDRAREIGIPVRLIGRDYNGALFSIEQQ